MDGIADRWILRSLLLATLLGASACGGAIHVGEAPTTRVLRTTLADDGDTAVRLRGAARAQGCVLRRGAEPTTRVLATCGDVDVLFAAGPWKNVLSVQCLETSADAVCGALAERIARAAMRPAASVARSEPAVSAVSNGGDAR